MLARKLTQNGIDEFADWLQNLKADPLLPRPVHLLHEERFSRPLDVELDARYRQVHSRLELAEHLSRMLGGDPAAIRHDNGFWTWMSLCWFDQLCPVLRDRRQPGISARWIADLENPRRACRHLLAGPYQILRAHRDDPSRALSLLCGPVHQVGPLVRLLGSRPSFVTCSAVVGAATRLYYNHRTGRNRPGSGGNEAGSPARLVDILSQLELTWDLQSLTAEELLALLPPEFDHFHRSTHESAGRQKLLLE